MTTPTTVQARFQLRADTAANWTSVNPTLLNNEFGLETDTKKLKVGTGSTAWNSLAYFPSIVSGGTVLGNLEIGSTGTLTFEGSTADGFETTLAVTNPTADRTITLPNQSGTVVVSGNASIVDADIAANAEIAVSKLANGAARQLLQTDAAGTGVEWTDNVDIPGTLDVTSTATFDGSVTIAGDLTVNGTTTTVNSETLLVKDKNIEMGVVATPTDLTADGGGITLKGTTDKTINWVDATDAWTSSEYLDLPAGAAGTPSLFFGGDVNSGLYSPGADQVAISTAGTGRLFVAANGKISIGEATTAGLLHLGGATPIISANKNGSGTDNVFLYDNSVATNDLYVGKDSSNLIFRTAATERLRITSDGKLGLGTSAPSTSLEIASNANAQTASTIPTLRITNTDEYAVANDTVGSVEFFSKDLSDPNVVTGFIRNIATSAGVSYDLVLGTKAVSPSSDAVERLRITSDGKLGLGTSSPGQKLDVVATSGTNRIRVSNTGTTSGDQSGIQLATPVSNYLIYSNGSENKFHVYDALATSSRLVIDSSGNVGVGTTSPSSLLHLSADAAYHITLERTGASPSICKIENSGNLLTFEQNVSGIAFETGSTPTERARIDSSGRLLVGASTSIDTRNYLNNSYGGPSIQQHGITQGNAVFAVYNWGNNSASPAAISLNKSLSGAVGTRGALTAANQDIGAITFLGDDGTAFIPAATIIAEVDGTPGANDMPGRIVLSTTADGASTPTERLRITSAGLIGVGASAPSSTLEVTSSSVESLLGVKAAATKNGYLDLDADANRRAVIRFNSAGVAQWSIGRGDSDELSADAFHVSTGSSGGNAAKLVITSTGKVGLGTSAPAATAHVAGSTIISNVDVANASYDSVSFSVLAQEGAPSGLFFRPDGRKMFVCGITGDDINEYTLSTPWDVSTATYVTVFSVASEDTAPQDLYFRNDGKKLFVVGASNDSIYQYSLSTPWSIASASYDSVSFSVATEDTVPAGLFFKPDGLAAYIVGTSADTVRRYSLTTAWDISTAALADSFSVAGQETAPQAVHFTADGSRMFVLGNSGDDVNIYSLTTPWDITTASFVTTFSVAAQEDLPTGLFVKPDGTKFFVVGQTNDTVYRYSIPSATIDLTGTTSINGSAEVAQDLTIRGGVGFYGTAAIAQPAGTGETTGFTAGTGTAVNDASTFTGNLGTTAYRINDVVKALKQLGLLAL